MNTQETVDELMKQLEAKGFILGGAVTVEDLTAFIEGRASGLYEFGTEVMTRVVWLERFSEEMMKTAGTTPEFAKVSAEAVWDSYHMEGFLPEEAADEEMACWGE